MSRPCRLSFEFFPPHSIEATLRLWRSVERLAPLAPDFVSVTYGAGGATRDRTLDAIKIIQERARLSVAGHLTCVGASREETIGIARGYKARGASRIVALRGDPPKGDVNFKPHPNGFSTGLELVTALAKAGFDDIVIPAYPEVHPEAKSDGADLDTLKAKQDAGATMAVSQFCFDAELFLRFRDRRSRTATWCNDPNCSGHFTDREFFADEAVCEYVRGTCSTNAECCVFQGHDPRGNCFAGNGYCDRAVRYVAGRGDRAAPFLYVKQP